MNILDEKLFYYTYNVSLQEVERKHEAMLQMYGEKAEEAEELKLDIDDLKTMYRQQVRKLFVVCVILIMFFSPSLL